MSADTIRIAVTSPIGANWTNQSGDDADAANRIADLRVLRAFADHVARYYELYGRALQIVEVPKPEERSPAADFALMWWRNLSEAEEDAGRGRGSYCYVAAGARFTAGSMPADADTRLFDPDAGCR